MRFNIACPLNTDLSGRYRLKNRDLVEFTQSRTLLVNFLLSIKQQCYKIRQINRRSFFDIPADGSEGVSVYECFKQKYSPGNIHD